MAQSPGLLRVEARYKDQVEGVLAGRYRVAEQFTDYDYLFQPA
jgi:hypothetical protein